MQFLYKILNINWFLSSWTQSCICSKTVYKDTGINKVFFVTLFKFLFKSALNFLSQLYFIYQFKVPRTTLHNLMPIKSSTSNLKALVNNSKFNWIMSTRTETQFAIGLSWTCSRLAINIYCVLFFDFSRAATNNLLFQFTAIINYFH